MPDFPEIIQQSRHSDADRHLFGTYSEGRGTTTFFRNLPKAGTFPPSFPSSPPEERSSAAAASGNPPQSHRSASNRGKAAKGTCRTALQPRTSPERLTTRPSRSCRGLCPAVLRGSPLTHPDAGFTSTFLPVPAARQRRHPGERAGSARSRMKTRTSFSYRKNGAYAERRRRRPDEKARRNNFRRA